MQAYIVYEQTSYMTWTTTKVFLDEQKAKEYCDAQNAINKPEYDSYGYIPDGGPHTGYYAMEVEQ